MLNSGAAQVAEQLGGMLVSQSLAGFQLDNQFTEDKQVGKIITKHGSVLIEHLQGVLLLDLNTRLAKPVGQPVLINFFQMPVP